MKRAELNSHRRRVIIIMAVILFFGACVFTACYFSSTEKMRPLYLVLGMILEGLGIASAGGMLWLFHREAKKLEEDE